MIAASASRMAAPFSPAQAKNSRLNAPNAPLRRALGSSQYTARDSGRKINRNCTEENAIQTAPFEGFFGDSQKVYMCYNSL